MDKYYAMNTDQIKALALESGIEVYDTMSGGSPAFSYRILKPFYAPNRTFAFPEEALEAALKMIQSKREASMKTAKEMQQSEKNEVINAYGMKEKIAKVEEVSQEDKGKILRMYGMSKSKIATWADIVGKKTASDINDLVVDAFGTDISLIEKTEGSDYLYPSNAKTKQLIRDFYKQTEPDKSFSPPMLEANKYDDFLSFVGDTVEIVYAWDIVEASAENQYTDEQGTVVDEIVSPDIVKQRERVEEYKKDLIKLMTRYLYTWDEIEALAHEQSIGASDQKQIDIYLAKNIINNLTKQDYLDLIGVDNKEASTQKISKWIAVDNEHSDMPGHVWESTGETKEELIDGVIQELMYYDQDLLNAEIERGYVKDYSDKEKFLKDLAIDLVEEKTASDQYGDDDSDSDDDFRQAIEILNSNPVDKIFPITTKSSGGIDLDTWEKALQTKVIPYTRENYEHYISYNPETGEKGKYETREQIVLGSGSKKESGFKNPTHETTLVIDPRDGSEYRVEIMDDYHAKAQMVGSISEQENRWTIMHFNQVPVFIMDRLKEKGWVEGNNFIVPDPLPVFENKEASDNKTASKITLEDGQFGWDYLIVNENGNDILIQNAMDYPGTARTFGWDGEDDDIMGAQEYLDNHIGDEVEDPGYFENEEEGNKEASDNNKKEQFTYDEELYSGTEDQIREQLEIDGYTDNEIYEILEHMLPQAKEGSAVLPYGHNIVETVGGEQGRAGKTWAVGEIAPVYVKDKDGNEIRIRTEILRIISTDDKAKEASLIETLNDMMPYTNKVASNFREMTSGWFEKIAGHDVGTVWKIIEIEGKRYIAKNKKPTVEA